jgi:TonB family protein
MASKRDVSSEMQRGAPNETDPDATGSDSVDALVSGFLAELTDIYSEMKKVVEPYLAEKTSSENETSSKAKQAEIPPSPQGEEVLRLESEHDLEDIGDEVEETLIELERLKSQVIPIADRRDARPESLSSFLANLEPPPVASSPHAKAESAISLKNRAPEQRIEDRPAIFPASLASPAGGRKSIILLLVAAVFVVVFGCFYFFQSHGTPSATKSSGKVPNLEADRSERVPVGSAVKANELPDLPPGPAAQQSGPFRQAGPNDALVQSRGFPGASSRTAAKPNPDGWDSGAEAESPGQIANVPAPAKQQAAAEPAETGTIPPPFAPPPPAVASSPVAADSPQPLAPAIPNASGAAAPGSVSTPPASPAPREPSFEAPPSEAIAAAPPKSAGGSALPVMAEAIAKVQPTYPLLARMQKVAGKVDLEVEINDKGDVVRAKAVSGPVLLRSAAEEALMKWKFKPASLNGINIASQARISVAFNLKF